MKKSSKNLTNPTVLSGGPSGWGVLILISYKKTVASHWQCVYQSKEA